MTRTGNTLEVATRGLYEYFEFATPQRIICNSEEQYKDLLRRNIKFRNCYRSLYKFAKLAKVNGHTQGYDTALVDNLYFDFDSNNAHEKMLDMHEHLLREDILHHIRLTGRGYAVYVECEPYAPNFASDTVYNAQMDLSKKCRFKLDNNAEKSDTDLSAFGNISKVTRIIGTFNFNLYKNTKLKVFCSSIPHKILYTSIENVRNYARNQHFNIHYFGTERILLPSFDYPIKSPDRYKIYEEVDIGSLAVGGLPKESLLPCVISVMNKKNPSHMERVMLVAELSYILRLGGIIKKSDKLIDSIVDTIRGCNYADFDERKTRYQVKYIVNSQDSAFGCKWKKQRGMCVKEC